MVADRDFYLAVEHILIHAKIILGNYHKVRNSFLNLSVAIVW